MRRIADGHVESGQHLCASTLPFTFGYAADRSRPEVGRGGDLIHGIQTPCGKCKMEVFAAGLYADKVCRGRGGEMAACRRIVVGDSKRFGS